MESGLCKKCQDVFNKLSCYEIDRCPECAEEKMRQFSYCLYCASETGKCANCQAEIYRVIDFNVMVIGV